MSRSFEALRSAATNEPDSVPVRPLRVQVQAHEAEPAPSEIPQKADAAQEVRRIAEGPKAGSRIVPDLDGNHLEVREHFRYLEHELRKLRHATRLKRLLVTSAAPREGKTVISANLAATLACSSPRVLLIDADLRGPGSGPLLGVTRGPGLADVLEGHATISDAMLFLEALNVYHIPAGRPDGNPAALLQSDRMQGVLKALDDFDWLILDSPPIGAFADALSIAVQVDGVLVVARSGQTGKRELEQTLAALKDYRIAGLVLNGYDKPQKHYYYSYYRSS